MNTAQGRNLPRWRLLGRFDHHEFGIDAVEYVNQFFMDKAEDTGYISEMKKRAEDEGVKSLLQRLRRRLRECVERRLADRETER